MRTTTLGIELAAGLRPPALRPILVWAKDAATGKPRHILELDEHERGDRCGCVCPACGLDLTAVNAATDVWVKRPHFRHPNGVEHADCNLLAARYALLEALRRAGELVLPMRKRSATVTGLSGAPYTAWVDDEGPRRVHIRDTSIVDTASAVLELDDGRRLLVELVGAVDRSRADLGEFAARITITVDDPEVAAMDPAQLLDRLRLLADGASWQCHWADAELDRQALASARAEAEEHIDLDADADTTPANDEALRSQRRESLLHAEIKAILANAPSIAVPALQASVSRTTRAGTKHWRTWERPAGIVRIVAAQLEHRIGQTVPDVVTSIALPLGDGLALEPPAAAHPLHGATLLIEATVSNLVHEERLRRIEGVGLPALEIDVSRAGGHITRTALRDLVIDGLQCKRWLFHPLLAQHERELAEELDSLVAQIDRQAKIDADAMLAVRTMSAERIGEAFLGAVMAHCMYRSQTDRETRTSVERAKLLDLIDESTSMASALAMKGYPEAKDKTFYMNEACVLSRLLSIKLDRGVGYRLDTGYQVLNAIRGDGKEQFGLHRLYLFATKLYEPRLTDQQSAKIKQWSHQVRASLDSEKSDSPYRRNRRYDLLLGLLFPEMAPHLVMREQPGSGGAPRPRATAEPTLQPARDGARRYYLQGPQLEAWLSTKTADEAAQWREYLASRKDDRTV